MCIGNKLVRPFERDNRGTRRSRITLRRKKNSKNRRFACLDVVPNSGSEFLFVSVTPELSTRLYFSVMAVFPQQVLATIKQRFTDSDNMKSELSQN
jgi:hypothetical protein